MNLVNNNPYRILGLLSGATAREKDKQIRRLLQYIHADQEPPIDFHFPQLGPLIRTTENVNAAVSQLNLDIDKMGAALFWFFIGNEISDEPAFNALTEGNLEEVVDIWTQLTSSGEVTKRNASAYCNLGTLYLSGILNGTIKTGTYFEKGISLKLKFLESDFIKEFKASVTDVTYQTTKKDLQLLFLNQVQVEIEKKSIVSSSKLIDILTKHDFSAKEEFLIGFLRKPIEQTEKKIEKSKNNRNANKANAIILGKELFEQTAENLMEVKSIVGESNIKYASIADKVANEILQCSIDYFRYNQENDGDINYFDQAWKLAKSGESLAIGTLTKVRIKDSLAEFEEMKEKEISQAIEVLQKIKDIYESNKSKIIAEVSSIRLGYNQTINWSRVNEKIENSVDWSKVVELIQEIIPAKNINKIRNAQNATKLNKYKGLVDFLMGKLSYSHKDKIKYICYWNTLTPANPPPVPGGTSNPGGSGCYIATMAYGDYEHPQVMLLRQFRDDVLDKSAFGKWFINKYYHYSPILVERLKNKKNINIVIRKTLNQFIKLIKK